MNADNILDQIDNCLGDYSVSGDAMRHAPDLPPPFPVARPRANGSTTLARRLTERHDLTSEQARAAVLDAEQGNDTEHARLAAAEAQAIWEEAAIQIRAAFRPMLQRVTEQFAKIMEALQHLPEAVGCNDCGPQPRPRDRPAWQSSYGPPRRR